MVLSCNPADRFGRTPPTDLPGRLPRAFLGASFLGASFLSACLLTWPTPAAARTIVAASGSAAAIQSAINRAAPGDTVEIPEGKFDFSGQVHLTDEIDIRGAGRDRTELVKTDALGEWKPMFRVDCKTGRGFDFSGLTLHGKGGEVQGDSSRPGPIKDHGIVLQGACRDFRIFGSRFTKFTRAGIEIVGTVGSNPGEPRGVIYDNEFTENWYPWLGYGVAVVGHPSAWQHPIHFGDEEAVYIEDNTFVGNRHAVAANNGGSYVFRHNLVRNARGEDAAIDAHGRGPYWERGTRRFEIYRNTVSNDEHRRLAIGLRGGSGVVFENEIDNASSAIVLMLELVPGEVPAYPVKDQIADVWIWGNVVDHQKRDGIVVFTRPEVTVADFIKEGRDFFNRPKPGYTPLTYPHPLRARGQD